jgi:hypothetical protein
MKAYAPIQIASTNGSKGDARPAWRYDPACQSGSGGEGENGQQGRGLGVTVASVASDVAAPLGLPRNTQGLVVKDVDPSAIGRFAADG